MEGIKMNELSINLKKTIHAPIETVFDEEARSNHEGGWGQILETLNTIIS